MPLVIADKSFQSRLFIGTGKFSSPQKMQSAVEAAGSEVVTVAFKRIQKDSQSDAIIQHLQSSKIHLLPNTSGVRNAKEAVFVAQMAREALDTHWLKLEIHPDPNYLMPDPVETLKAAEILIKEGFVVLPYIHADPVLCKKLEDIGIQAVMPLGAPIGSNLGLSSKDFLRIIIEQSNVPVIVDAGIGAPSHAALAMEMGADAVLVNTAIAVAKDPEQMAIAFKYGVEAGRIAYTSGLGAPSSKAVASSPLTSFLNSL